MSTSSSSSPSSSSSKPVPVITMFDISGRPEYIKLVLEEAGVPYSLEKIEFGAQKSLDVAIFQQLPAYRDEHVQLVQSTAAARYVAKQYDLYPTSIAAAARADMFVESVQDWMGYYFRDSIFHSISHDDYIAASHRFLKGFQKLLLQQNKGQQWIEQEFSFGDLALFQAIDMILENDASILNDYPLLHAFRDRVAARPNIQAYLASNRRPHAIPFQV